MDVNEQVGQPAHAGRAPSTGFERIERVLAYPHQVESRALLDWLAASAAGLRQAAARAGIARDRERAASALGAIEATSALLAELTAQQQPSSLESAGAGP